VILKDLIRVIEHWKPAGRIYKKETKMECPKCHKKLVLIKLQECDFYCHTYSLSDVTSNKPLCEYSKRIAKNKREVAETNPQPEQPLSKAQSDGAKEDKT
jgi:ssDNA-binding Zn-finger/Zn-ribbon topoisomerase 1